MPKKLILRIPNIPYGPADDIDEPTWHWLKVNHRADYDYAQKLIKAHEEEQAAEEGDKADDKPTEAAKPEEAKPAVKTGKGG